MSNSKTEYNEYVRANLPNGMTFDSVNARYRYNNHAFVTFKSAEWYYNYINKTINLSDFELGGLTPILVNIASSGTYLEG